MEGGGRRGKAGGSCQLGQQLVEVLRRQRVRDGGGERGEAEGAAVNWAKDWWR